MSKKVEKAFDKKVQSRFEELRSAAQKVESVQQQIQRLNGMLNEAITRRVHLEGRVSEALDSYAEIAGHSHPIAAQLMASQPEDAKQKDSGKGGGKGSTTPPDPPPESDTKKKKKRK